MKETLKRLILKRSFIILTCFCFLIMGAPLSAETLIQTIWPGLSPEQWYWYEPETNFPLEQIEVIFKDAETVKTSFWYAKFPNSLYTIQNTQFEMAKDKSVKNIKFKTSWAGINNASGMRGSYTCLVPPDAVREMSLFYNSSASNDPWRLKVTLIDSVFIFFFKDENAARQFGNAFASILGAKGLSLKFPRFGMVTSDLTAGQAEALGKSRIENVLITNVAIDGPADKAGLRPLDVITEVNGIKIKNNSHFISLMEGIPSGTKLSVTCLQREKTTEDDKEKFVWKPKTLEATVR
jgi:hypothetical protein